MKLNLNTPVPILTPFDEHITIGEDCTDKQRIVKKKKKKSQWTEVWLAFKILLLFPDPICGAWR